MAAINDSHSATNSLLRELMREGRASKAMREGRASKAKIAKLEDDVKTLYSYVYTKSQRPPNQATPFQDEGNEVVIGNELEKIRVSKATYDAVMQQSNNAQTFLLKFLSENAGVYTNEELLMKNWNGGTTVRVNGGAEIAKGSLMKDVRFKALLAQAKRPREAGLDAYLFSATIMGSIRIPNPNPNPNPNPIPNPNPNPYLNPYPMVLLLLDQSAVAPDLENVQFLQIHYVFSKADSIKINVDIFSAAYVCCSVVLFFCS